MTKMRFDPSFIEHERWEQLGVDALVLHMAAIAYTCRTLSDGFVSAARVRVAARPVGLPGLPGRQRPAHGWPAR